MKELYKTTFGDSVSIKKYKTNCRICIQCDNTGFSFVIPIKELINYLTNNSNKENKESE